MEYIVQNYTPILIFAVLAIGLGIVIILLPFLFSKFVKYRQKQFQYECGFHAFSDTRSKFNVQFSLIAILFIIFDLEIIFLFPWVLTIDHMSTGAFFSMLVFLLVLLVGFVYEWRTGALDWNTNQIKNKK